MPNDIENKVAYLHGAKIGQLYGSNYMQIDNQGNISFNGTAKITTASVVGQSELVTMGLGGDAVIDTFPFNTVTLTEAASTFAKVSDGGVFEDLATSSSGAGYTANYQIFPDTEVENDAAYFGATAKFGALYFDMSATVAVYGADSITWEYYNGTAWTALTILYDNTDTTANDGLRPFQQDGYILFSAPADWASLTVDSQAAYWIRARCNATVNITTIPLTNSKEHQIPSNANAFELPYAATISRCRFQFDIPSTGTADTKFILYNFTTGAASAEQTITKALTDFAIADIGMTVAADDELGIYISQIDGGGTEYGDGHLEMKVTRV
jgi:hypothetical protein